MEAQNRSYFLFYAIPDAKPLRTFAGIALEIAYTSALSGIILR
jgi:hypothetical protein